MRLLEYLMTISINVGIDIIIHENYQYNFIKIYR